MGAAQSGLPQLSAIPKDWRIIVLVIKDCFFSIPLHKEDTCRFAFTVPATNHEGPDQRYEWTVLPQGMANSPTMCQAYVDKALQPIRKSDKDLKIYHYMDDVLLAHPDQDKLFRV